MRRLRAYRPMIQRVLHEEGLPPELVWIGLVESGMARLRLVRVPQLLIAASLVAGFAVVLVLR